MSSQAVCRRFSPSPRRELKPRLVGLEIAERELGKAGVLELGDAVFDARVLAVQHFERGDVASGLVGDEALKAMPVDVGE